MGRSSYFVHGPGGRRCQADGDVADDLAVGQRCGCVIDVPVVGATRKLLTCRPAR